MNPEQDPFEQELHELVPTRLPEEFTKRLTHAQQLETRTALPQNSAYPGFPRLTWLRWVAPSAVGVAATVALILHSRRGPDRAEPALKPSITPVAMTADNVQIDRHLVSSFSAQATLPSGEPVKVLCREWMDQVVLSDSSRGVAIQQRTPRFEIIPVEFETF